MGAGVGQEKFILRVRGNHGPVSRKVGYEGKVVIWQIITYPLNCTPSAYFVVRVGVRFECRDAYIKLNTYYIRSTSMLEPTFVWYGG